MSSIFQVGPLTFKKHSNLNYPYFINEKSGFVYNEKMCYVVGKFDSKEKKFYKLSEEDKKWASILNIKINEEDEAFKMMIVVEHFLDNNKDNQKQILNELLKIFEKEKEEEIIKIEDIQTKKELLDYISYNPQNVDLALLWCKWSIFDKDLIRNLYENKLLNPFQKSNVYDGSDAINLDFYEHCKLLAEDVKTNQGTNQNYWRVKGILGYLNTISQKNRIDLNKINLF